MFRKHFSEHPFDPFVRTIIGNDVWIGECAMIKAGVRIGNGAVIGMGSVLTSDVGDYEIWAGNPARFIRKRFDEETVRSLSVSKWWNAPEEELKEKAQIFNDTERFVKGSNGK